MHAADIYLRVCWEAMLWETGNHLFLSKSEKWEVDSIVQLQVFN